MVVRRFSDSLGNILRRGKSINRLRLKLGHVVDENTEDIVKEDPCREVTDQESKRLEGKRDEQ